MPTLQAAIVKSLPTGLALPDEIAAALEWMDTNKCVGTVTRTGEPYGVIDPGDLTDEGERQISLAPVEPEYVRGWVKVEGAVSAPRAHHSHRR